MYYLGCYAYYELNIDYIIENYCVNTDKPEMSCDGKCYLAQQMQIAQSNSNDDQTSIGLLEVFVPVYYQNPYDYNYITKFTELQNSYFSYFDNYQYLITNYLFKPPIA